MRSAGTTCAEVPRRCPEATWVRSRHPPVRVAACSAVNCVCMYVPSDCSREGRGWWPLPTRLHLLRSLRTPDFSLDESSSAILYREGAPPGKTTFNCRRPAGRPACLTWPRPSSPVLRRRRVVLGCCPPPSQLPRRLRVPVPVPAARRSRAFSVRSARSAASKRCVWNDRREKGRDERRCDVMGRDGMGWDGMGWDGTGWDGIKMGCD